MRDNLNTNPARYRWQLSWVRNSNGITLSDGNRSTGRKVCLSATVSALGSNWYLHGDFWTPPLTIFNGHRLNLYSMTTEDVTHSDSENVVGKFTSLTVQYLQNQKSVFIPRWKSKISFFKPWILCIFVSVTHKLQPNALLYYLKLFTAYHHVHHKLSSAFKITRHVSACASRHPQGLSPNQCYCLVSRSLTFVVCCAQQTTNVTTKSWRQFVMYHGDNL